MRVDISVVPISNSGSDTEIIELIENAGLEYRRTGLSTTVEVSSFKELGTLLDKLNKTPQETLRVHVCCQSLL